MELRHGSLARDDCQLRLTATASRGYPTSSISVSRLQQQAL